MAEKNEVAQKQEFTTGLSQWTNTITGLVSRDFEQNGVKYDEYSKQCAIPTTFLSRHGIASQ